MKPPVRRPRPMKISDRARAQVLPRVIDTRSPFAPTPPPPGVAPAGPPMAMDDNPLYGWAAQTEYSEGLFFPGYPYLAELTQRPEYRRITEILAKDMTRRWVTVTSTGDENGDRVAALTDAMRKFGIQDVFRKVAELDGFFGRGHIYVDTGKGDDPAELETPLFLDRRKIKQGSLVGFRTVEPLWTYPNAYNSNDPLNVDYYRPRTWLVMGKSLHRSRFLTFVSRPVPDILKPAYSFGGISMSQLAKPYVDNWIRTRQSVSDLISNYSKDVIKTNLAAVLDAGGAENMIARAEMFTRTRDNRGVSMVDMETEDFVNVSTPLGSLDKLQAQSQEQMASVAGLPLVVLLGITPSGLNASSDGEIKTYYAWVASQQEALFSAPLKYIMDLIQLNEFGDIDDTIVANWNSLWEDDDTTTATIRKTNADTDMVYVDGGVLSPEEVRTRLAADRESPYHGIDVTDVPEPPEPDVPDDGGEEANPFANDAGGEHWITVHPNGKEDKGQPLLVQSGEGNTVTVKGGAGGKLNGRTLTPGSMSKARSGGGESGGGGGQSEPDKPKEPERPAHEAQSSKLDRAVSEADALGAKAKTAEEHLAAKKAYYDAARLAEGPENYSTYKELMAKGSGHHWKWNLATNREKKKATLSAHAQTDDGAKMAERDARFKTGTSEEIAKEFKDKFGLGFANGSNAGKEYRDYKKEAMIGYWALPIEQQRERQQKLFELKRAVRQTRSGKVRGHTEYDIDDGSAGSKAARKTIGHVANAMEELQKSGFDVKKALDTANVSFAPGNVGKALGHAFQLGGVGHFTLSSGKNGVDTLLDYAKANEARLAAGKSRWTVGAGDGPSEQMRAVAVHELAHALGMQSHINSPKKLQGILGDLGLGRDWVINNISQYAATNALETDAELAAMVTAPTYVRGTLPKPLEDHVDDLFHHKGV